LFRLILGSLLILTVVVSGAWSIPQAFAPGPPLGWVAHPPIHARPFATSVPTGLFPSAVELAYGLDHLSCSLGTASTSWTYPSLCGHGQAVAIVDAYDDPTAESDLGAFSSYFGLPGCTSSNGCFVKAMPQGQPISNAGWALEISLDIQWAHAIAPGARILLVEAGSNSFSNLLGAVNYGASQSGYPVHQVSMSWGGSEFSYESLYDSYFSVAGVSFFASSGDSGTGPIWPSASPYVIGVGGTTLQADTLTETAWSGSGGGTSLYEFEPSFQSKYPIPNTGGARGVPDVSYDADPNTGVSVYDSTPYNGQSGWFVIGGTSVGAPSWNAIFAIINSKRTSPISSVSFGTGITLYGAATGSVYASNYRDIESGSNGNCGFVCNAQTGYDFVTGLGSPLANNLVPYLQPSSTPSLSLSANPSTITTTQSSTITVSTNDGKSNVMIDFLLAPNGIGSLSASSCSTNSGQCFVYFTPSTTGSATVTASNTNYNSAQTTITVTQPPTPSLLVSANPTVITTAQTSTITASASDGKSGVTVTFSSNIGSLNPISCSTDMYGKCTATFSSSVTGTATITATDLTGGYTAGQTTVTVNSATSPTLSVSVATNKGSYKVGQLVTITVTVTSSGTPVSGATVSMTVYYPNGSPVSSNPPPATTGSNGKATFRYLVTSSAPKGTYTAVASASLTGYTSGSGSTTFMVK
jgi:subtilase family serine protease